MRMMYIQTSVRTIIINNHILMNCVWLFLTVYACIPTQSSDTDITPIPGPGE